MSNDDFAVKRPKFFPSCSMSCWLFAVCFDNAPNKWKLREEMKRKKLDDFHERQN